MKCFLNILLICLLLNNYTLAQSNTQQQNGSQPKDAPVDVRISDFKKNLRRIYLRMKLLFSAVN